MAQIRICDRCGAAAEHVAGPVALLAVVLPATDPGTNVVAKDFSVSVALQIASPQDLCRPCQAAALIRYAEKLLGGDLVRKVPLAAVAVEPAPIVLPPVLG